MLPIALDLEFRPVRIPLKDGVHDLLVFADGLVEFVAEHEEIIDAIHKGDPDRAEIRIQANWEHGVKRLSRLIEDLGERGSW